MTNTTRLFSASVGKLLTAVVVMQQVEAGRFALDSDVNTLLPFPVRNPRWPAIPITWRMLLTHSSSIAERPGLLDSLYSYGAKHPLSLEGLMQNLFGPGGAYNGPATFDSMLPGTARQYSDFAVDLAGYGASLAAQRDFSNYVATSVLQPLRMVHSTYDFTAVRAPQWAIGYERSWDARHKAVFHPGREAFGDLPPSPAVLANVFAVPDPPSGALYTTATDLAQLAGMFLNHGQWRGSHLLDSASVAQLFTPSGFWSPYGYQQGLIAYATRNLDDQLAWGHDGQDRGYVSALFLDLEHGVAAVAIANANSRDFLMSRRLVDVTLHLLDWYR